MDVLIDTTRHKIRTQEQKIRRRQREQRPRVCPFCSHVPFTSASGFRDHVILVHQRHCSWSGIVRPFTNAEEERLTVNGVLHNSGRRSRVVVPVGPPETRATATAATASSELPEAGRIFRLRSEPLEVGASNPGVTTSCEMLAEPFYDAPAMGETGRVGDAPTTVDGDMLRSVPVSAASSMDNRVGPSVIAPTLGTTSSADAMPFSPYDDTFAEIVNALLTVDQSPPYDDELLFGASNVVAAPVCEEMSSVAATVTPNVDYSVVIESTSGAFSWYVDPVQRSAIDASILDNAKAFDERPSSGVDWSKVPSSSSTTGNVVVGAVTTIAADVDVLDAYGRFLRGEPTPDLRRPPRVLSPESPSITDSLELSGANESELPASFQSFIEHDESRSDDSIYEIISSDEE